MISWAPSRPSAACKSIDIRPDAETPWNRLSPDYQHGQIPIPGIKGMYSDCVTGIMEGLKLTGPVGKPGKINPGYFTGPGRPRTIENGEWFLGYRLAGTRIDLGTARRQILIPSYHWVLYGKCHDLVANLREMGKHREVLIHDGIENHEIDDPAPLSLAFVLVAFLNRDISIEKPLVLQ